MSSSFGAQLKKKLAYPLSGNDLKYLLKDQAKILTYKDILKFNNVDDLFYPYNAVVLLYLTSENYGHWVALIRHPPTRIYPHGYIEHMDSYGIIPDDELSYASLKFRRDNNLVQPHLLKLYANSDLPIEYNHTKLQRMDANVASCGRWAALRILLRDIPLKNFVKFSKSMQIKGISPDMLITMLTADI